MKKFLVALMAALTCFACVACAPANLEKAEEKMEEAGYEVIVSDKAIPGVDGSVGSITAGKIGDGIIAVLFESKADAKEYYEEHKDEGKEDQVVKQDGKWVYMGTEDAIEDFTK